MEVSESRFSDHRLAQLRANYGPVSFDALDLMADDFLLESEPPYAVYYAPVDSWPRPTDRVILVGLTPGLSQTELAARLFMQRRAIAAETEGPAYDDVLRSRVAFARSMRSNLCQMLDDIGLPDRMCASYTADLFSPERHDMSTTSALIFPTFKNGKNLSGLRAGKRVAILDDMIHSQLLPRLLAAPNALIIPFGKSVEHIVCDLADTNPGIRESADSGRKRVLSDFPHPSGASGHRARLFRDNRASLESQIETFFAPAF